MPVGLYIHVPFCVRKCFYCDFYSVPVDSKRTRQFVTALEEEISHSSETAPWSESTFSTLYLGGGTPTVLPSDQFESIIRRCLANLKFEKDAECTVEANPETIDEEKLKTLQALGMNRLSLGLQSFHDDALRRLDRVHTVECALNAYQKARRVGFRNIGLDLIFALPDQSLESWKETLRRAVELEAEHLSTYSLTVEPGTPLAEQVAAGRLSKPPEELEADMYECAIDFLEAEGYEHYEISNFARPGYRSRHNLLYWDHSPYLGLGPSAHSFFENYRSERVADVDEYVTRIQAGQSALVEGERLSEEKLMAEAIFLALRKREGVDVDAFRERFGIGLTDIHGETIEKYVGLNMLEKKGSFLRLTRKGLMVANTICAEFM